MKKNNKGFTLIELLAIIVILAIIAVITVPIILNIIENSRKGAATDSAYGYKDSINKYYVSELSNNNKLMLNGTYEVKANGVLNGNFGVTENSEDRIIPVDGTKPSSGKLHYTNNVLDDGCLVIGDYKITFGSDGKVNETVKGDCEGYELPTSEETTETCPGPNCYYGMVAAQIGEQLANGYSKDDYSELGNRFLAHILNLDGTIKKSFACGINTSIVNENIPFCLEGGIADETVYTSNANILTSHFNNCTEPDSEFAISCSDSSFQAGLDIGHYAYGDVNKVWIDGGGDNQCWVDISGYSYCD